MIEVWDAMRLDHPLGTGRTRPLVIECESRAEDEQQQTRRSLVVKAFALPEVTESGLFCELIGNLLARDFGIDTPTPGLVDLSSDFVEVANAVLQSKGLRLTPGWGVGCEYLPKGFISPAFGASLTPEEIEPAALIYAFDLLTQNPDRHARNPNCLMNGGQLVAIDFNAAFSFIYAIGRQDDPWRLSRLRFEHEHLFRRSLRHKSIDWQPFLAGVREMSRGRIENWCRILPPEWQKWTERVCEHLLTIQAHADELQMELQRSLT